MGFLYYIVKFILVYFIRNRSVIDIMNWNKGGFGIKRGFGFGGFVISVGKKEELKFL